MIHKLRIADIILSYTRLSLVLIHIFRYTTDIEVNFNLMEITKCIQKAKSTVLHSWN